MIFSQPLDKRYTKTPNVFFEEILCAKGTTFNESKLMGYLIRNTLGYNHKAAWVKVSRNQLSEKAYISYGSINPTIQSCVQKGWILEFKHGEKGREVRYLFLRTPRNEQIVKRLEKGDITLANLGSLIDMDIENVGVQYGVRAQMNKTNATPATDIENKQDKLPHSNSEQVSTANNEQAHSDNEHVTYSLAEQGYSKLEQVPCTADEEDPCSDYEHLNEAPSQQYQGFEPSLKTITNKNKSIKDKNNHKTQQPKDVVVVQKQIMDLFHKRISRKNVESLILLAEQENVNLDDMIQNTYEYHEKVQACRNIFGAIKYAIEHGQWDISVTTNSCLKCYETRVNSLFAQTQEQKSPRAYNFLPAEEIRALYGLA